MEPVAADHAEDVVDHRADRDFADRPAVVAGSKMLDVTPERRPVDVTAGDTELVKHIDLPIGILGRVGKQGPDQLLLDARTHGADHAEVDDADPPARLDEEVARMRIGMEEAVPEHHLQHHPGAVHRHLPAVDAGAVQGREVVHLDAVDPLEGKHAARRLLPEDAREIEGVVVRKVLREPLRIAALLEVIGLGAKRLGELVHQADDVILLGHGPAPAGRRCQVAKDLQVLVDLRDDTGSLHLDDDAGAVGEGGRVDLADRGRRQRNVAEAGEHGVNRPAELRRDDVRHDFRL